MPTKGHYFSRIFPLIFTAAGAIALCLGLQWMQRAKASTNWPTAPGVVVSSEVQSRSDGDTTTYGAEILYEYEVDGVRHSSSRVGYGDYSTNYSGHARNIVKQYPKGAAVTVHYMPEKPGESVLEPGVHARTYFVPALGAVFTTFGLLMLWFLTKEQRRQTQAGMKQELSD